MNQNNEEIVNAIENISSISEQSAAGAQQVTASMYQENQAIEEVANSAENLSQSAKSLDDEISKFKL